MTKNDIFIALQEIYPLGVTGIDASIHITDYASFAEAWGSGPTETLPTEAELQAKVDAAALAIYKAQMKSIVKAKAGDVINSATPEWKQRNCLAFSIEYNAKLINSETVTAAETTEYEEIESLWAWVKTIRAHSNSLEIDIDAGNSVDIDSGWPEQ